MGAETHDQGETKSHFRLWLTVLCTVLVGSAAAYFGLRSPEPAYQGKTSAEWFREFRTASSGYWVVPVNNPWIGSGSRALDTQGLLHDRTADGLRALGTNAALYLGREFAREDGAVVRHYRQIYTNLPVELRKLAPRPPVPRNFIRIELAWALECLGQNATPAVPALASVLRSRDTFAVTAALRVLRKLDFDPRALDVTLEDFSRDGEHRNVLRVVEELQLHTTAAATCLGRALSFNESRFRVSCEYQLQLCGTAAIAALPELTSALGSPDEEVRYGAARALQAIGIKAAPAVPALIQATNDTSVMVQRASARVIRIIQGQTTDQ